MWACNCIKYITDSTSVTCRGEDQPHIEEFFLRGTLCCNELMLFLSLLPNEQVPCATWLPFLLAVSVERLMIKRALLKVRDKLHTRESVNENCIAILCTVSIQKKEDFTYQSSQSSTFHSQSALLKKILRILNFFNCSYTHSNMVKRFSIMRELL